jgi:hypothetical protein
MKKWDSMSPVSKKRVLSVHAKLTKNVNFIAGSKGLSPLAGFGAEPQENIKFKRIGV